MLLTKAKGLLEAQRDASRKVAQGKKYSVDLPIIGRVPLPPPEQLAIYAALGGLAVLELIDWPVALAMGVGSALVSRHLSELEVREDALAKVVEPTIGATPEHPAPKPQAPEPPAPEPPTPKPSGTTETPGTAETTARTAPAAKTPAKKTPARKAPVKKAAAKAPRKKAVVKAPPVKAIGKTRRPSD